MRLLSKGNLAKAAFALVSLSFLASGTVYGSFVASVQNAGNEFSARHDLLPPEVYGATTEKYQGGVTGWIGASRSMYSYARVDDLGNPPIGIELVQAQLGSPAFDADMSSGSWTAGGSFYNYRTPRTELPSDRVTPGNNPMSIYARDDYGQSTDTGGFTFRYDPVAPIPGDVELENGAGTQGVPDAGDTIKISLDEPGDPSSLIGDWENAPDQRFPTSWDGSTRDVTVQFESPLEYGVDPDAANRISFLDGTGPTRINLGQLEMWANQWGVDCLARFESSSMEMSFDNSEVTVTLGGLTPSGSILTPAPDVPEECS